MSHKQINTQLIPNKVAVRITTTSPTPPSPPSTVTNTTTRSLPIAILASVLNHHKHKHVPLEPPTVFVHIPILRAPVQIGITTTKNIYAGDVPVGFYDIITIGDSESTKAFESRCKARRTIPYYFSNTSSTVTCAIAIGIRYHHKKIPLELHRRLTATLHPSIAITTLTN